MDREVTRRAILTAGLSSATCLLARRLVARRPVRDREFAGWDHHANF